MLIDSINPSTEDDDILERDWPPHVGLWAIQQHPTPLPTTLIEGVLQRGLRMALGGGAKTCKTWVLSDLAISVASGIPWMGIPTKPGKVLFINFEIDNANYEQRILAIAKARGIEINVSINDQVRIWNLRGYACSYKRFVPKIIEAIKDEDFSLIIIDPIYMLLGSLDENKAGDITRLMNMFEKISRDTKAAIAFSAHFSKGNQADKNHMERISGSGVFGRNPDTVMTLTSHSNQDSFTADFTIRNGPRLEPFVVKWKYPVMERDTDADPHKLARSGGKKTYDAEMLLKVLPSCGFTRKNWFTCVRDMPETKSMSSSTFDRLKDELMRRGFVVEVDGIFTPVLS